MADAAHPGDGGAGTSKAKQKSGGKQTVAQIIAEVAKSYGIPPAVALSIASQESGLNPDAVGDGGTSFGIYQLHEGGELGSHSEAWAENVKNNAETALREVAEVRANEPDANWGKVAADAQRPKDRAGYAASVDSILNTFQSSGQPNAVTYFENHSRSGASLETDGDGGGGGGDVVEAVDSPQDVRAGLDSLGFASALINSNKSLSQAYHKIIADNIDLSTSAGEARAKNILQNTAWFQNHSKSQREFDELKFSDPKEFQSQIAQQEASLKTAAGQAGVTLDGAQLGNIAKMSLRNGLNTDQINQVLASHFDYKPGASYTGQVATSIGDIQKLADDYYVPTSNAQMQKYVQQSIAGELDPTTLTQRFQQNALSLFPYLKEQLQSGQTVADVADPYKQMMANTLEIDSAGIKNNDPTVLKALQSKDANGNQGLMPLYQFQNQLYSDPRWMATDNAHQTLTDAAGTVLAKMGLTA